MTVNSRWPENNLTHIPVLREATLSYLNVRPDGIYVDGTVGLGGHAEAILRNLSSQGLLVGLDCDAEALKRCKMRLSPASMCRLFHDSYDNFPACLDSLGIHEVDGMLLDLGLSSFQLGSAKRGFSHQIAGPLDMRFDSSSALTAEEIVNKWEEKELTSVFKKYGEERYAAKIARRVVEERRHQLIRTTTDLRDIIAGTINGPRITKTLSRVFQALRIVVNHELETLQKFLDIFVPFLTGGGRIVIISYHSLEDRLVKGKFRALEKGCTCPPDFPVCRCGKKPELHILTRKVVRPEEDEIRQNIRARSARLRAAKKTG